RRPRSSTLVPYTTLFRSRQVDPGECGRGGGPPQPPPPPRNGGSRRHGGDHAEAPVSTGAGFATKPGAAARGLVRPARTPLAMTRSEEHTSELQSRENLVC